MIHWVNKRNPERTRCGLGKSKDVIVTRQISKVTCPKCRRASH